MLELAPGGRDVGVPALGHPAAGELHVALVERRLELQQEQVLLDVEDRRGHDPTTLASERDLLSCVPMSSQYIFTMHRLSKVHPPDKTVLENITLAFYPGAKIGVLGYNGAGKSTLLRIMAGVDQEYRGEAALAPGATVGMLEQEPQLDETKDVRGNVEDGVAETKALLDRFNELAANYSEETAEEFGRIQAQIEAADAWNLDTQLDYAMDALRLPAGRRRRHEALRRRAPPRGAVPPAAAARPTCCCSTSPPTTSTPSRSRGSSSTWPSTRARSSRSPTTATSSTTSPAGSSSSTAASGIPYEGNYSSWLEQKQARLAQEERSEKARQRTIAAELEWVRTNPKGRRTKSKARLARYEELIAEERNVKLDEVQIHIPPGPRLGEKVLTANDLSKGFGERLLIESLSFDLPRAGIVGVIGANGAGKTTLFRMITGEEPPDAGTLELGDTVQLAYVDQSRDALDPNKTVWEEISEGLRAHQGRRPRGQLAPVHGGLQLQGLRPAGARSASSPAASATACTSPSCCAAAATCCCSTSPPTTSTSTRCARSRTRCSTSPAARS